MKTGQLVVFPRGSKTPSMMGFITSLDPFNDGLHTEIHWFDEEEPGGMITSVWVNEDFEVIGSESAQEEQ